VTETIKFVRNGFDRWLEVAASADVSPDLAQRATRESIEAAICHLGDAKVVACNLITSGQMKAKPPSYAVPSSMTGDIIVKDLPHFWEVLVDFRRESEHVARINVWVPVAWNRRFMGVLGGGNRLTNGIGFPDAFRPMSLPFAIRNGFAAADTDGGNRDPRFFEWGLKAKGQIDWDLTENWLHRGTHEMTLVGKAVAQAIHGLPPEYSYAAGCSGGGRQALVEAQRYPEDYDGIWSSDPAINWTRFLPAEIWPALVMKEFDAVMPPAKLEAFRTAAIEACDGIDGLRDGMLGAFDPCDFDARSVVGTETAAGPITDMDAEAMNRIWEGPRTRDGRFLWYGIPRGTESWGNNFGGMGLCCTTEVDGKLVPVPPKTGEGYLRAWIKQDPEWDWQTLTFEDYESVFERSVRDFSALGSDDPNLTPFRDRGGKLILSHGHGDQVIMAAGSIDYYRRVVEQTGSLDETRTFARLFLSDGDGHAVGNNPGPGLTVADTMTALMEWVELGKAPDQILGTTMDIRSKAVLATRPIYAYPNVTRYSGYGDPKDAASYVSAPLAGVE